MRTWINRHPNLVTWAVLSVGMVAILIWSASEAGLNPWQWLWLSVATVLVAGLCAWIISWEADEAWEEESDDDEAAAPGTADAVTVAEPPPVPPPAAAQ